MDFLTSLRDLPRRQMRADGEVDYARVAEDLGISTEAQLQNFLLQLYRLDATVNHYVNARLLYFFFGARLKGKLPVLEVPPGREGPWRAADAFCEGCPGSGEHEPVPGVVWPLCGSSTRIEKWESCMKYRENLREAEAAGVPEPDTGGEARSKIDEFERTLDTLLTERGA